MADVVARSVAVMQAGAPPGALADELGSGDDFRLAVHQAAGMVSVQLGIPVDDALARLRAFAFAAEESVSDVAHQIVARQLRLDGSNDDPPAS